MNMSFHHLVGELKGLLLSGWNSEEPIHGDVFQAPAVVTGVVLDLLTRSADDHSSYEQNYHQ